MTHTAHCSCCAKWEAATTAQVGEGLLTSNEAARIARQATRDEADPIVEVLAAAERVVDSYDGGTVQHWPQIEALSRALRRARMARGVRGNAA